jgi:predicted negative regulator of RcsB-dependent stress response
VVFESAKRKTRFLKPDLKLAFYLTARKIARSDMQQDITESAHFFKFWAWFEKNRRQIAWSVGGVVAVAAVIAFVIWSRKEKEVRAAQALSSALSAHGFGRVESPEALLKVAAASGGTEAGAQALLLAAGELFAAGKPAEALPQFERFLREHPGHALRQQAMLGVAASQAAQGKLDEAASAYKNLVDRFPNANTAPQARFALAGIYESQGRLDQALRLFEEVARADTGGSLGTEAGLKAHELQLKLPPPAPMLAPSTAAATNAPLRGTN